MDERPERDLKRMWEQEAGNWITWARAPRHDSYWDYGPRFLEEIVPPPSGRTLEIGCGEGRVARDLASLGHDVFAIDASPTLISAAMELDPKGRYINGDAAALPFPDELFQVVVTYNSLMDMDDLQGVVQEAARSLAPGGHVCICVTHPISDVGAFESKDADARFIIEGDYLDRGWFDQTFEQAGMVMRFRGYTYPLESYFAVLESAGLLVERLREPRQTDEAVRTNRGERRWQRLPNFLFIRAVKPAA